MAKIARDLLKHADNLIRAGGVPDGEAARLARMAEQGYRRGLWRGGKTAADGNYFTPDQSAAEDFAKRHGPKADVREYAIKMGNSFDFHGSISTAQMQPIIDAMNATGHSKLAKQIYDLPDDYGGVMPSKMLYHVLDTNTGGNAMSILKSAGYDTLDARQEVIALHRAGTIRDANRAQFDPGKSRLDNIFASVAPVSVPLGIGAIIATQTPEAQANTLAARQKLDSMGYPQEPTGTITPVEHPMLNVAADAIDKYVVTPIPFFEHPLSGTSNLLRNFGRERPVTNRLLDAVGASLDYF